MTLGNLSCKLRYSTDRAVRIELVRGRQRDRRTSRQCRHESRTARPVGKRLQKIANFHSTFGESLGCRIQYSHVRHLHADRQYRTLQISAIIINTTMALNSLKNIPFNSSRLQSYLAYDATSGVSD